MLFAARYVELGPERPALVRTNGSARQTIHETHSQRQRVGGGTTSEKEGECESGRFENKRVSVCQREARSTRVSDTMRESTSERGAIMGKRDNACVTEGVRKGGGG